MRKMIYEKEGQEEGGEEKRDYLYRPIIHRAGFQRYKNIHIVNTGIFRIRFFLRYTDIPVYRYDWYTGMTGIPV